jgi:hypothetical protein
MTPRTFGSPGSQQNHLLNITKVPSLTASPLRFLSPIPQGTCTDPPTLPEAGINLPTQQGGSKTLTKLVSDSISEALTDLVGNRAREAIYDYMERKYSVGRNEITEHLDRLFTLFEGTFGVGSTKVIGRIIAKKVYAKLDWNFESLPNLEFADYMERIKSKITREALEQARSATPSCV